eukprot:COSAG01_NODE_3570_length_5924_cov_4.911588_9_plen_129_part_00
MAVALVNMGAPRASAGGSGASACTWNHTKGGYVEACDGAKGNLWCGDFGSVATAQQRCCDDPACVGFSLATVATKSGPANHGCLKTGSACGFTTNVDFDGYQRVAAPPPPQPPLAMGFEFTDVGFGAR